MAAPTPSALSVEDSVKNLPWDVEQGHIPEKRSEDGISSEKSEEISPWHHSQFPDGGPKAWLCLAGVGFAHHFSYVETNIPSLLPACSARSDG